MMNRFFQRLSLLVLSGMMACSNPANKRAVSLGDLDSIQAEDKKVMEQLAPKRDMLTTTELTELAGCSDLPCVQLYMKNLSSDFVQGYKGEFYAAHRITIKDTSGNELTLPASAFYVDVNPQATWRAAYTVHTKEQGDSLLNEFKRMGFQLADEGYYPGMKNKQQRYISAKYPGKSLYVASTFRPWYSKGLYKNKVTWPCYVFEVYKDR